VLGGSSAPNGMIYVRGARQDFGNWAYNGAAGWSSDEVLPFFKRSEDFEDGPSRYHGSGGPLPVTRNHSPNPVSLAFLHACADCGLPLNDDRNGERIMRGATGTSGNANAATIMIGERCAEFLPTG
jgi:choline dehydrogenase